MEAESILYRPPSEAFSLLVRTTVGCPHNDCTFCGMYKGVHFRIRDIEAIKDEMAQAAADYGQQVTSIFLPDGNSIVMRTDQLAEILSFAWETFDNLSRVTCYASAKYVGLKNDKELRRLHGAGLTRLHMGVESGDDATLERIRKGANAGRMIDAGRRAKAAGFELSEYILVGIAGPERSEIHARESARVVNAIGPDWVRLRTFVPFPGSPMFEEFANGRLTLLSSHECLKETRAFVENLTCHTELVSDHVSNYANISGFIPDDKEMLLEHIDKLLTYDESRFRDSLVGRML